MSAASVQEVRPDLSPMVFHRAEAGGRVLILNQPLQLQPYIDESLAGLISADDPGVGLMAAAATRAELESEVVQHLFFVWDEYAQEAPERLAPGAQALRFRLLARMRAA